MSDLHTSTVKCIKTLKLNPHGRHSLIKLLLKAPNILPLYKHFKTCEGD